LFVDGTCGSNDAGSPAAQLSETAYNLTVDVYGNILGASGKGGGTSGAPAISGQKGGDALEMTSTNGANNIVLVRNGSKVYGGGGGGEKGRTGVAGSGGSCYYSQTYVSGCQEQALSECSGLLGGSYQTASWNNCCRENRGCAANYWYRTCRINTTTSAGSGGIGGNGGPGRGYNNQSGSLSGAAGSAGSGAGSCPEGYATVVIATNGPDGETGAAGGEWASSGGNIADGDTTLYLSNFGNNGGAPGKAIFGSNYSTSGTINADTVKGSYT
ncbi:hypothetical protein EBR43_07045, partial [bacterium]|nr:hypothetical protein [bacterium]